MAGEPTIALLQRMHEGDREALVALIERNLDWVREHVHRRLGPVLRGKAETVDFVQDAMIDFLEYGPRFELSSDEQLRALLARIVENNLRDDNRKLRRERRDVGRERGRATDTVLRLDPPRKSIATPSRVAEREERHEWIRLALEFLDPADRQVIWLREWEGKTFDEIAAVMELTESGARMRYNRALPKLAEHVGRLRRGMLANML